MGRVPGDINLSPWYSGFSPSFEYSQLMTSVLGGAVLLRTSLNTTNTNCIVQNEANFQSDDYSTSVIMH